MILMRMRNIRAMAMKKAIIRIEVEYNQAETNPNAIAEHIIEIVKQENRYQLTKVKNKGVLAFIGDKITEVKNWSILCIYYPYSKSRN